MLLCRCLCGKKTVVDDEGGVTVAVSPPPAASTDTASSYDKANGEAVVHANGTAALGAVWGGVEAPGGSMEAAGTSLTVKVEVHSSSSGAGSEENLSSSDLSSERSSGGGGGGGARLVEAQQDQGQEQHEYEDIYQVRQQAGDSGSHSRDASTCTGGSSGGGVSAPVLPPPASASTDLEAIQILEELIEKLDNEPQVVSVTSTESGVSSGSPSHLEEGVALEKHTLSPVKKHSTLPHPHTSRVLKRVVSEPGVGTLPPPPPPPPPQSQKSASVPSSPVPPPRTPPPVPPTGEETAVLATPDESEHGEEAVVGQLVVEVEAEPTSQGEEEHHSKIAHGLVNKQMVLPFVPPKFPSQAAAASDNLIKPSEYLRSLGPALHLQQQQQEDQEEALPQLLHQQHGSPPPPPPPPPPLPHDQEQEQEDQAALKLHQPLGTISVQDLRGVQLRRTEKTPASKTMSAPPPLGARTAASGEQPFQAQKEDLIAELKMSKDIIGIKKMKVERAKVEEQQEKEIFTEITKTLTVNNFVEKVPDKDATGNPIPPWKRQMLAKKAAEKARKELEEQMQKEAEHKRLQSIPPWKRQLLAKKEETNCNKPVIYTPKVVEDKKVTVVKAVVAEVVDAPAEDNKENSSPPQQEHSGEDSEPDPAPIMPWRAQLRKTNSKLSLLE